MHEQMDAEERISLTDVAKLVPGRPTANAIWRWCRRGVLARNGVRVRLQHVRMGGRILTTRRWLDEFGKALADADAQYFDTSRCGTPAPESGNKRNEASKARHARSQRLDRIERELEGAGL